MMDRDLLSSEFARRVAIETLEPRTLLSAGALDGSFGTAGQVTLAGSTPLAFNREPLAVQSDGKIVIAVGGSQTQIERLNSDGSPDNTFGSHGVVASPVAGVNALAVEPDGKIVLGGYESITTGSALFALARLNADGTLDMSFGSSGTVTSSIDGYVGIQTLAIGADGKIIAAGIELPSSSGSGPSTFHVARYSTDGTLDPSFNGTGEVSAQIPHSDQYNDAPATPALALQPNGQILIGAASNADLAIWRFNADGSSDAAFGAAGEVTTPVSYTGEINQTLGTDAAVTNLIVLPNGQILAGGTIISPASDDLSMLAARYNADGTLATGPTIVSPPQFGYETEQPAGMALQADGKIVLGWYLPNPDSTNNQQFTYNVQRFNADLTPDSTFALPSDTTIPVTTLAMASGGQVIVAGATSSSGPVVVSRLLNDAPASSTGGSGSNGNGSGSNGSGSGSSGIGSGSSGTGSSGSGSHSGTGSNSGTTGNSGGAGSTVGNSVGQQPLPPGQISASFIGNTPATGIAGAKAPATLRIINSGGTSFSGPVSITVYASTDGTLSASAVPIATFTLRLKLRSGAARTINLKFKYPATLSGGYTLLAALTETAAKTAPAVAMDPRGISLAKATEDLAVLPESAAVLLTAIVSIENLGNTTATGGVTIALAAVPETAPTSPPDVIATLTRSRIHLKPGGRLKLPVHFLTPTHVARGSYQITASISSPHYAP